MGGFGKKGRKEKSWKKRQLVHEDPYRLHFIDKKGKIQGSVDLTSGKSVYLMHGKEKPHIYQITIITEKNKWKFSFKDDKEKAEAWLAKIDEIMKGIPLSQRSISPREFSSSDEETPTKVKKQIEDKTNTIRRLFLLDGYESYMYEAKCSMTLFDSKATIIKQFSGILYITQNFLCFAGKHGHIQKIPFMEIVSLTGEVQFTCITVDKERYDFYIKCKEHRSALVLALYLWYHAPTYLDEEIIQNVKLAYEEDKRKQKEEDEKMQKQKLNPIPLDLDPQLERKKKDEATRKRILQILSLDGSRTRSRRNLPLCNSGGHIDQSRDNITVHNVPSLNTSKPVFIINCDDRSEDQNNDNTCVDLNPHDLNESIDLESLRLFTQFKIEIAVLYVTVNMYIPAILEIDKSLFKLLHNADSCPKLIKNKLSSRRDVFNIEYSYNAISSVTVDLESVLIRFQGHELEVRIVSAYTQLIINQIYMRCLGKIEMKWGPSNNFPYKEPLITKYLYIV